MSSQLRICHNSNTQLNDDLTGVYPSLFRYTAEWWTPECKFVTVPINSWMMNSQVYFVTVRIYSWMMNSQLRICHSSNTQLNDELTGVFSSQFQYTAEWWIHRCIIATVPIHSWTHNCIFVTVRIHSWMLASQVNYELIGVYLPQLKYSAEYWLYVIVRIHGWMLSSHRRVFTTVRIHNRLLNAQVYIRHRLNTWLNAELTCVYSPKF